MKNTFVKVLSFLMALTMIVGMFGAMTISASAHTHTKGEKVGEPVPATCASFGYTLYECATCGETYPDDIVPVSKEHTGVVDVEATEATCTYPAMTAGQFCEDCETWVKGKEAKPVKDSNPLGHTFVGGHMGTSCYRIEYYVCITCNLTFEEAYLADAKDRTLAALKVAYPEIEWAVYDPAYSMVYPDGLEHDAHDWEYEVKTAPKTCEDGLTVGTCVDCGATEEIVVKAEHKFDASYKPCEAFVGNKCSLCGADAPNVVENVTGGEHTWAMDNGEIKVFRAINSALQALGYTNKTIYVEATCDTDGHYVQFCTACNQYYEFTVEAEGHDWKDEVKTEATGNENACAQGYTVYRECNNCDEIDVLNTVADRGHVLFEKVVNPTCTAEGYTEVTCLYPDCTYNEKINYVSSLGHAWDEYVVLEGGYNAAGVLLHSVNYVLTRYCAVCGAEDEANRKTEVRATVDDGSEQYDDETGCYYDTAITLSAASCSQRSAYIQKCTVGECAGFRYVDKDGNKVDAPVFVGDYNKGAHTMGANLVAKQDAVASTCAKEGYQNMFCTTCQVDVKITFAKTAHTWDTKYDHGNDGKMNTANDKDFRAKESTCTTPGQTAGVVCKVCGTTKVAPKTLPKNPNLHKDTKGTAVAGQVLQEVAANCQNGGWVKKYYKCCDATVIEYNKTNGVPNDVDPSNHVNKTIYKYNAVKCDAEGNHLYYICNDCGTLEIVTTITYGGKTYNCGCGLDTTAHSLLTSYVIPETGHTGVLVNVEALDETCDTHGYTAHQAYVCNNADCEFKGEAGECEHSCGCTIGKKVIVPHGSAYVEKIYESTVTCTEDGIVFPEDATYSYVKDCTKCFTKEGTDYFFVDAYNHSYEGVSMYSTEVVSGDCTADTYEVHVCAICGDIYADEFVAAKYDAHRYDVIKHKFTVKNGKLQYDGNWVQVTEITASAGYANGIITRWTTEGVTEATATPACMAPTFTYQLCVNAGCNGKTIEGYTAAVAHYSEETGEKVEITWNCDGFKASLNMTCELCGETVNDNEIEHTAQVSYKPATCTENGYYFVICTVCGTYLDENGNHPTEDSPAVKETYKPTFGHNPYDIDLDGYADYSTTGRVIANSIYAVNSSVVYVVEAKDATAFADGYIKYLCRNCNEIVTVVIPAVNALDLVISAEDLIVNNGVATLNVAVSANNFTFNTITLDFYYDEDVLEFNTAALTYAGFEAADAVTVISKNNGDLATVNVYVPNGVDGLPKNAVINGEKVAFLTLTFKVLPTATDLDSDIIDEVDLFDAKYIKNGKLTNMGAVARVEIDENVALTKLGDANADNRIDAGDSIAIMSLLYSGEYNVAADINGDGVVDLADHVAVLTYNVSYLRDWDYLAMMGVTIESVVADYNLAYDLNNDRAVNDTDKAMLVSAINKAVAPYDFFELDYATLEELVADVADQLVKGEEVVLDLLPR